MLVNKIKKLVHVLPEMPLLKEILKAKGNLQIINYDEVLLLVEVEIN